MNTQKVVTDPRKQRSVIGMRNSIFTETDEATLLTHGADYCDSAISLEDRNTRWKVYGCYIHQMGKHRNSLKKLQAAADLYGEFLKNIAYWAAANEEMDA